VDAERTIDWWTRAECQGQDPELFFPVGDTGSAHRQLVAAKRVCATCTVVGECLQWAMGSGVDHGVWGGMSETERRTLKRRTRRDGR
jgi:WhiB family redox-sensing transcriptional regulator